MFQPHADIVFASLAGSDVARQYGLTRRPECLIECVSVSEIPLPKKLGHEGMPGKVAEKGNPQNVHDDLRGGYLPRKPPDECLAAAGQYQRFWMGTTGVFTAEAISQLVGGLACSLTMYFTVYRPLGRLPDRPPENI